MVKLGWLLGILAFFVGYVVGTVAGWSVPTVLEAQDTRPQITLAVDDSMVEVGETVTVTWTVAGADSVSVRRDGAQISTGHSGSRADTPGSKGTVQWEVTGSNRAGSVTKSLDVQVVSIGSVRSWLSKGSAGAWVSQLLLSIIPGFVAILYSVWSGKITQAPFIFAGIAMPCVAFLAGALGIGNYWLATSQAILVVLSIMGWIVLGRS